MAAAPVDGDRADRAARGGASYRAAVGTVAVAATAAVAPRDAACRRGRASREVAASRRGGCALGRARHSRRGHGTGDRAVRDLADSPVARRAVARCTGPGSSARHDVARRAHRIVAGSGGVGVARCGDRAGGRHDRGDRRVASLARRAWTRGAARALERRGASCRCLERARSDFGARAAGRRRVRLRLPRVPVAAASRQQHGPALCVEPRLRPDQPVVAGAVAGDVPRHGRRVDGVEPPHAVLPADQSHLRAAAGARARQPRRARSAARARAGRHARHDDAARRSIPARPACRVRADLAAPRTAHRVRGRRGVRPGGARRHHAGRPRRVARTGTGGLAGAPCHTAARARAHPSDRERRRGDGARTVRLAPGAASGAVAASPAPARASCRWRGAARGRLRAGVPGSGAGPAHRGLARRAHARGPVAPSWHGARAATSRRSSASWSRW